MTSVHKPAHRFYTETSPMSPPSTQTLCVQRDGQRCSRGLSSKKVAPGVERGPRLTVCVGVYG